MGIILLTLIELEVYSYFYWCPKFGCRSWGSSERRGPVLMMDDDVLAEEKRVEA